GRGPRSRSARRRRPRPARRRGRSAPPPSRRRPAPPPPPGRFPGYHRSRSPPGPSTPRLLGTSRLSLEPPPRPPGKGGAGGLAYGFSVLQRRQSLVQACRILDGVAAQRAVDPLQEPGEHAARPHLEKDRGPLAGHPVDAVGPADGRRDLADEERDDVLRLR